MISTEDKHMNYVNLGKSGLRVSPLCLGTMTFGEPDQTSFMHKAGTSEQNSFAIMDAAIDNGINFFDTANVYGNDGLTEKIMGKWFDTSGKRDKIVLATKFRFTMGREPNDKGASRRHILRAVEDSLQRLQTDYIDLYQIHMQDPNTPEEETLGTLNELIRSGKVRYIGCSNYTGYRLERSQWIAQKNHWEPYISLQAQYNLISRTIERELTPVCRDHNLGIMAWSPLSGGFLSGKVERGKPLPAGSRLDVQGDRFLRYNTEKNWQILEELRKISVETGASCSQIALAWLLTRPQMASVIIGVRTQAQFDDNLKAAELKLSKEHVDRLNKVSMFNLDYPHDFLNMVEGKW